MALEAAAKLCGGWMRSSQSLPSRHCSVGFLKPCPAFDPAESVQRWWEDPTQQRTLCTGTAGVPAHSPVLGSWLWQALATFHPPPRPAIAPTTSALASAKGRGRGKGRANPGKSRQSSCKTKCSLSFFIIIFFSPILIQSSKLAKIKCAIYLCRV